MTSNKTVINISMTSNKTLIDMLVYYLVYLASSVPTCDISVTYVHDLTMSKIFTRL